MMPSVLLIADRPGWAYDILAKILKEHLADWIVDIKYIIDIREDVDAVDLADYDVVFFFLWFDANRYGPKMPGFRAERTCVGVHSLASWGKRGLSSRETSGICNTFGATGVISEELRGILELDRPFLTPNGVDATAFAPRPMPPTDLLVFTWAGNPSFKHHGDNKGFESIIWPVFESLGDAVELRVATPAQPIPRDEMGGFYAGGHVLLCMSEHEGGPLPVVEAMHVGRPVISTSVGIVPEIVKTGINGWIIERSAAALTEQIRWLVDNPGCLDAMGLAAHEAAKPRGGTGMAGTYDKMFRSVLEEAR